MLVARGTDNARNHSERPLRFEGGSEEFPRKISSKVSVQKRTVHLSRSCLSRFLWTGEPPPGKQIELLLKICHASLACSLLLLSVLIRALRLQSPPSPWQNDDWLNRLLSSSDLCPPKRRRSEFFHRFEHFPIKQDVGRRLP